MREVRKKKKYRQFSGCMTSIDHIVCVNYYLANKRMDIKVPQAVLPDIIFKVIVRIPYNLQLKQVLINGKKRSL